MGKPDISQQKLHLLIKPILQKEGKLYQKCINVYARKAAEGEQITTITGSGEETTNVAEANDNLVINQTKAKETYLVPQNKFNLKYKFIKVTENGLSEYRAVGKIYAIELSEALLKHLDLPDEFHFEAPWKEAMLAQKGDYLAMPLDYSEVYRIAHKEFFETYQLQEKLS